MKSRLKFQFVKFKKNQKFEFYRSYKTVLGQSEMINIY